MSPQTKQQVDVVVLGGGSAGLWTSYEIAGLPLSCAVVDEKPFSAYASTLNQGWLQSGAFYIAHSKDVQAAMDCWNGYQTLQEFSRNFARDAIHSDVPSYLLFREEAVDEDGDLIKGKEQLEDTLRLCRDLGIPAQDYDIERVKASEPLLDGARYGYAAHVADCPVSTTHVLSALAEEASKLGVSFHQVSRLDTILPVWDGEYWHVELSEAATLTCKALVVTAGVYIPDILRKLNVQGAAAFNLTKIPVLVMHEPIAQSLLVTPGEHGGPSLVPFFGKDGRIAGATVCLLRVDDPIESYTDKDLPPDHRELYAKKLGDTLRGVRAVVGQKESAGNPIPAHFYVCQKLSLQGKNISRGHIVLEYAPGPGAPKNILTFYPGKFTAAPVAARECVAKVRALFSATDVVPSISPQTPIPIATQLYYKQPDLYARVRGENIFFEPK
ncbi:MAG: FAD-binding oxidoreductase [Chloroflexota bacterium]|nr:FAD-binding oxidoreductase [Chloroflexota bacterium]